MYILIQEDGDLQVTNEITEEDFVESDAGLLTIIDANTMEVFWEEEWVPLDVRNEEDK